MARLSATGKKRVCLVRHWYYPQDNHLRRDAEALRANGWEVEVICLRNKGEKPREVINKVQVYRLPVEHHRGKAWRYIWEYSAFFFLALAKLALLSLRKRHRAIEVSNLPDILVFSSLVPKLLGARVILYMRERMPEGFALVFGLGEGHPFIRFLRLQQRVCLAYADHIIVVSRMFREHFQAEGAPGEKITVIENVPDDDVFHPLPSATASSDGHFRLMTHSTLLERKGVQTLLRAVPLLLKEIPNLEVWVAGDGEYRPALEGLCQELGVADRVRFTGWLPFGDVPSLISRADVGIVSMNYDALPNKLFEYLAMGKPVVASDLEPFKAYVPEGAALYFRSGDEGDLARRVLELYRDPEKGASVAAQGQAVYEQYRWSITKQKYLAVFEQLR